MSLKGLLYIIFFTIPVCLSSRAQPDTYKADSWSEVFQKKSGTVTALWYDIEPFIYTNNNTLMGVEYEVMESIKVYLKNKYAIDLNIEWINAGSFESIYSQVKNSKQSGLFGWSYYSITTERQREVKFTSPYMPDLNILITDNNQPIYSIAQDFVNKLPEMRACTMEGTTMEEDINNLKKNFLPSLKIITKNDDYDIMRYVADHENAIGYVPLSTYIVGLQKGIKVKRQDILISRRVGFAGVMPMKTDWSPIMNEYFSTNEFKLLTTKIVRKYLGDDVTDLVFGVSMSDSLIKQKNDLELVTKEKEIVTQRLIASAIETEKERIFRNIIILGVVIVLIFIAILYSRFVSNQKFAKLLQHRNETIILQKEDIEMMNKKLEMKVLLSQMNPHLIFNSLNAIQYFVSLDDKKNATKYINNFSRHLRLLLNNASATTVTIENEVKMLQQYLQLEQLRFDNKFDFNISVDKSMADRQLEIPAMLTYPFVEAALYQGALIKKGERGNIVINFTKKEGYVKIDIIDNGEGGEAASNFLAKREGNEFHKGIDFAFEHIELLNYRQQKKVTVQQTDIVTADQRITGSKVTISIPTEITI